MKKSVISILVITSFVFNCNAQNKNQEDLRLQLAQAMIDLTSSLNLAFENSDNVRNTRKQ